MEATAPRARGTGTTLTVLEQQPLTLAIPLREEPSGVLRVGKSRVLVELVIRAVQRGASPQEIVRMDDGVVLRDVLAVIAYSLAHPAAIDVHLCQYEAEAAAVRRQIEAAQPRGPNKEELLAHPDERA